jgi:hypothetical protein
VELVVKLQVAVVELVVIEKLNLLLLLTQQVL